MLKFLHTSDWQLGAGFGQIPGDKGALLRAERLASVERVGRLAREHGAQFIIVAGDFFDAHTIDNEVVTRTLQSISNFAVPVYVIAGNHDFAAAPECIYRRDRFLQCQPEQLHILSESKPVPLDDLKTVLLPCPLVQRHTSSDPTRWLAGQEAQDDGSRFRVGIAHGSVHNFDFEEGGTTPNLIDPTVAERARLDYLALGDWHGVRQINSRSWYSGTPEPDRFKNNDSGKVLLVEIDAPQAEPRVNPLNSSGCQWITHEVNLHSDEDVTLLAGWFKGLAHPQKTLVRLHLQGVLGMAARQRLDELLDTQAELLLHLRRAGPGVMLAPTPEELDSLGSQGLTGRVAESLKQMIDVKGENQEAAAMALLMLYQKTRTFQAGL